MTIVVLNTRPTDSKRFALLFWDRIPERGQATPAAAAKAAAKKPVAKKPAVKVEEKTSFLESLPRPTLGQFFIVFSFVTIISLMLGTFWVVVNAGGVHFNDS